MIVVAYDPGGTSGYAVVESTGNLIECGQFAFESRFDEMFRRYPLGQFVYESFRLRHAAATVGSEVRTLQVIGVLKYLASLHNCALVAQQPSCKTFYSNERLKRMGLYQIGKPHACDAIRHAYYFLTFAAKTFVPPS